ncbi:MAG TPA: hypothetical protein VFF20_08345 [Pseudogracilibacillus sp.]|nr:hypothetical protein [Pseudogracilibacillus sp.]
MSKNHVKLFRKYEHSSANALHQFETTIEKLRNDNEELANLHAVVEDEIEKLNELKQNIVVRISNNNNAVAGLERVLNGE